MDQYEIDILNNEFTENDILAKIRLCSSCKELNSLFNKNLFTIISLNPPFGSLGSNHLQKCFEIAEYFSTYEFIPDILELREKFKEIFYISKLSNKLDSKDIMDFFKKRFSKLSFTEKELKNIISKLTLDDYCSLDIITEKAIMQFNALEGIKTYNSCSGHKYSLRYFSASNLYFSIDNSMVDIKKVWNKINISLNNLNNNYIKIDTNINRNNIDINFFQIPSEDWVKTNSKKSIAVLCEENLEILTKTFSYKSNINFTNIKYRNSDAYIADEIRKLLWKHINALNMDFNISDEEDIYFWKIFKPRCLVFEIEYNDFYISKSAISNIKEFWNTLESVAISFRKYPKLLKK